MQNEHPSTRRGEAQASEVAASTRQDEAAADPASSRLRQVLPRLRDIALTAALTGPVLFDGVMPNSFGHGGGWSA